MAAACVDWDIVAGADFDAELVHAASETVARQSVNAAFDVTLTAILLGPAYTPVSRSLAGCGEGARRQTSEDSNAARIKNLHMGSTSRLPLIRWLSLLELPAFARPV
jgi:hypothetical protein